MTKTQIMRTAVRIASMLPVVPPLTRKLSKIDRHPAYSVVDATNASGNMVVQAYFARPALRMTAVPTQSATAASSWLAMPNIGQICEIEPVRMKYDQAKTTANVEISVPGNQFVFSNGAQARPRNSCTMKRATRVPVSTVVRMNSASNMMAKWYQYDIRCA